MRRRLALNAEILGRLDQAGAEVVLPDPVDDHAGRERVLRRNQPRSQAQPIALGPVGSGGKRRGHARLDLLALVGHVVPAALEHERRPRLGACLPSPSPR